MGSNPTSATKFFDNTIMWKAYYGGVAQRESTSLARRRLRVRISPPPPYAGIVLVVARKLAKLEGRVRVSLLAPYLGVAQLGSALALGARGRRFKSSRPDQIFTGCSLAWIKTRGWGPRDRKFESSQPDFAGVALIGRAPLS